MFRVQSHEVKSLRWWFAHRKDIDFSPDYQRKGEIWAPYYRAYLIDSIINEFDVPKIYLADFRIIDSGLNTKKRPYAIIDGRQRLESIFDFFNDKLPLNRDFIYYKDQGMKLSGARYSDLLDRSPSIASIFEEFNLHVMSVITNERGKINDLFVRLNTSKSLSGAEVRNAMVGPVSNAIRDITMHNFFQSKIRFQTKRGQDKNSAAKILLIEYMGKSVDTKRRNLDKFVKDNKVDNEGLIRQACDRVVQTLDTMCNVFYDRDNLLSSQGVVTVYYMFIKSTGYNESIRNFIDDFSRSLRKNKEISLQHPSRSDPVLLNYDIYNRSTNDQGSIQGRYNILMDRYRRWMAR